MSIIAISRGSYSRGSEVAAKVAAVLGYKSVSREVLLEASKTFNIPEVKLIKAVHDAPSILDRFGHSKERYVLYIRTALLRYVQCDNVVYHGFAGHFFLQGIPHVLKVRIIADFEERVREEMKREGSTAEKARQRIKRDDEERRKWGLTLYGMDTSDPSLYDLILNIKTLTVDDAVKTIVDAARLPSFQTTPESQQLLDDLVLASQVESLLVHEFPKIKVTAKNGHAFVHVDTSLSMLVGSSKNQEIIKRIEGIAINLGGAEKVTVSMGQNIKSF